MIALNSLIVKIDTDKKMNKNKRMKFYKEGKPASLHGQLIISNTAINIYSK